jgi:hypothetical protein
MLDSCMARRGSLAGRFAGPLLALSALCLWGCPQMLSDDFLVVIGSDAGLESPAIGGPPTAGAAGAGSAGTGSAGTGSAGTGSAGAGPVQNSAGASGAGGSTVTLRSVKQTLKPVLDRNLTGNYRSDDAYGDNSCVFADPDGTICIGDSSNANSSYRGFLTFDLSSLPSQAQEVSVAELSLSIDSIRNSPFAVLGTLVAEHVSFSSINLTAFDSAALGSAINVSSSATVNSTLSVDVLPFIQADLPARGRSQIRFRFSVATNSDNVGDLIEVLWSTPELDVTYLIP